MPWTVGRATLAFLRAAICYDEDTSKWTVVYELLSTQLALEGKHVGG